MTTAYVHATPAHHAFICNSWIESFRSAHTAGMIAMERWREVMWPEVERVLARPDAATLIACDPETERVFYGFICADVEVWPPIVFYAYVKEAYRRLGHARGLLEAIGIDTSKPFRYACKTPAATKLERVFPMAKWDPLAARFAKEQEQRP